MDTAGHPAQPVIQAKGEIGLTAGVLPGEGGGKGGRENVSLEVHRLCRQGEGAGRSWCFA